MNTKEKILKYLEFKGIKRRDFYLTTGLSNGFLDSGKFIGTDNAKIIISKYPDLSLEWLIMDEGEMIITKSNKKLTNGNAESKSKGTKILTVANGKKKGNESTLNEKYNKSYQTPELNTDVIDESCMQAFRLKTDNNHELQVVPLYDIEAVAGLVPLFNDAMKQEPVDYIQIPNLPKCDGAVYVTGDSMYPLLKSGDIVLYKRVCDIPSCLFWGEMYLVSIDMDGEEYVTVKYVQKSDIAENVRLVSYNQHHDDKDVPISKIRAMAFIKASIRINSMK